MSYYALFLFILNIGYLCMAALGLQRRVDFLELQGAGATLLFRGWALGVASPVAEHGLQGMWTSVVAARGFSSCGSWA